MRTVHDTVASLTEALAAQHREVARLNAQLARVNGEVIHLGLLMSELVKQRDEYLDQLVRERTNARGT